MDKAKGKAKEAAGAMSGNEGRKSEGQAEQRKADAKEKAAQHERTQQEKAEAKAAEKEQKKSKDDGLLGGTLGSV